MSVRVFACYLCGKDVDTDITPGRRCKYCGSARWFVVRHLTLRQSVRYWRDTGIWVCNQGGWLDRLAKHFNRTGE